jgi:hypothetical protein
MTTLTMRYIKGDFVVTGPDIEPIRFKTRREAKDWCVAHYPGSPIKEIGPIYKPPARMCSNSFDITADNSSSQQSRRIVAGEQLGIAGVQAQHLERFVTGLVRRPPSG